MPTLQEFLEAADRMLQQNQFGNQQPQNTLQSSGGNANTTTALPPEQERGFQTWNAERSKNLGLNPNPDDPNQFYDLRGAYRGFLETTGKEPPITGHLPDTWKLPGHPTFSNQSKFYQPGMQAGNVQSAPMPSMPSLGQASDGGGGWKGALGDMAKSFLGTAAETIPTALFNAALFGNNEMSQRMTHASMVDKLEQKRIAAERRRIDKVSGISTFLYSMQNYGKNYNVNPEDIEMALMTGTKTGVTDIDNQIGQAHEALKPMIESGEINAGDILEGMKKRAEYNKLIKGDVMSPEKFKQEVELAKAKQKPEKIGKYSVEGMAAEKDLIATREREKAEHRKPDKPDKPKEYSAENYILPDKTNVLSYDRGRSYIGQDGKKYQMPPSAIKVPGGATLTEVAMAKAQQDAAEELKNIQSQGGVSPKKSALQGTGPYKRLSSAIEAVAGGAGLDVLIGKQGLFPEMADAKQYLREVRQLGKAALMNSARGATWEQQKIEGLFPDPDKMWTNPRIEARKFKNLNSLMVQKKKENLVAITRAISPQEIDKLRTSNNDIDKLLSMVEEPQTGNTTSSGNKFTIKEKP